MTIVINDEIARLIEEEAEKACSECQEWCCEGCEYRHWRKCYRQFSERRTDG